MPDEPTALSVNLNKVALLRNSRTIGVPSVENAGVLALEAGAAGLTIHPRPDGRHIRPSDVARLARLVADYPGKEFNIEGNPFAGVTTPGAQHDYPGFRSLAMEAAESGVLHQLTLVPDGPGQMTSDHGWDLTRDGVRLAPVIADLKSLGARISLFMDPDADAMQRAADVGADRVELYTEPYARAFEEGDHQAELERYAAATDAALRAGIKVNAGHDLNLENLGPYIARIPETSEVSIGHALTADALWMGLPGAVRAYLDVLAEPSA